jgi:protein phosphatase
MSWQAVALTHRGFVRPANEDAIAVDGNIIKGEIPTALCFDLNLDQHRLMIADGMGGHVNGALASGAVLNFLAKHPADQFAEPGTCTASIRSANDHLYDLMQATPSTTGMGTTIVGVAFTKNGLLLFNVGDSRVYLHAPGSLIRLSVDDVPPVTIGASQRRTTHAITQALGGADRRTAITPHINQMSALAGHETILLCSDGLTDMLEDDAICDVLDQCGELSTGVTELNLLAMQAGGRDNISIVAVKLSAT